VYGDLDLSVIDEMPPGRIAIDTHIVYPTERERAYTLIRREVQEGRQAFIIYPLVEESEKTEALAAVEEYDRLKNDVFPGIGLGLLHGRLKAEEKEQVMTSFRDQEIQILVSTSVVEVGVDIPNASIMLIEGANRFGLAQLHQFRGRVGRGSQKSYCLLVPQNSDDAENERLAAMVETNDGFILAEKDLAQRGPGEFLGTRQSGYAELQMANLMDIQLIEKARREAHAMIELDPELTNPAHEHLGEALDKFWDDGRGDIS
jgi:ATP-dependent DNA helicase RecG